MISIKQFSSVLRAVFTRILFYHSGTCAVIYWEGATNRPGDMAVTESWFLFLDKYRNYR